MTPDEELRFSDVCARVDGLVYDYERYKAEVKLQLEWLESNVTGNVQNPYHMKRLFDIARMKLGIRPKEMM